MKRIIMLFCLLALVSCQQIGKTIFGFKDPKLENPQNIKMYLDQNKMQHGDNYLCKDKKAFSDIIKVFYKRIPEAILFDKNGNELIYKEDSESCNAGLFRVIPNLDANTKLKTGTHNIQQLITDFTIPLESESMHVMNDSDYYLMINWAIFVGNRNVDHVSAWQELAENNRKVKIKVVKLNMDFQDGWGLTEKEIQFK
ncbi:hypothetical protein MTP09_11895 [Chryseobacterium suipulveris]|uniref:Lipoprotein n=1 Tax=Chryseobacterium suipulveris TaxID=2929800 RepID=A0ABY4BN46_9FLAO|nr:hypothetical protein [Chryseobacterium suipulveris]UOE40595.1 hypothetical protein MTP09_11895 [Chryseobacterium suipulveris]